MKKLLVIFCFVLFCSSYGFSQGVPAGAVPCAEHYAGGKDSLYSFINSKLIYPPVAKRNRMQGECIVSFTIESDGTVSDVKIVKNIGGGTGEEAVRLVKLLKFNAIGYQYKTNIPVIFKL